ncbi:unnamed protein product [Peniophora sp. CBMAI 1063]|nr:unnamed protein product [Peniophora sp. CBMAI 1063]
MSHNNLTSAMKSTAHTQPPAHMPDALRLEIAKLESRAGKLRLEAEDMERDNPSFLKYCVSKRGNARRADLEAQGLDNFVNSIEVAREYRRSVKRDALKKIQEAEKCERKAGEARKKLAALRAPNVGGLGQGVPLAL